MVLSPHFCHAHDCRERVPPILLMCNPHWLSLPKPIRDAVWREYRDGQERGAVRPSSRYLAVQRLAVAHTALLPEDEEAALVAASYLMLAEGFAARAVEEGAGDPLEDLRPDGGAFR